MNMHGPDTYSIAWTRFADAVVEQILKVDPRFARAPMVPERHKRPKHKATGELGASGSRIPTPPAFPSSAAVTANLPTLPPGPARAEHADQPEAHQERSSPTVDPLEEETTHVAMASATTADLSGQQET
eukprot:8646156-Pyramimonas_sp.AAC.1